MKFYNEKNILIDHMKIERNEQLLVDRYILENDIVLELGARYGTVSCTINKKLNFKNNQVVVEPDNRVWSALENNMKINNCNFYIVKGFVSKEKLNLTNLNCYKGGYGSKYEVDKKSKIDCITLNEIKKTYNLTFNVLVADCEGFLERFFDENPILYKELRLVIFEADWAKECNYNKIKKNLKLNGFKEEVSGFQNVYIKN